MKTNHFLFAFCLLLGIFILYQNWGFLTRWMSDDAARSQSEKLVPDNAGGGANSRTCFMYGSAKKDAGLGDSFESLGGSIRIWLDAKSPADCKNLVSTYCRNQITGKGFLPDLVKARYRPPGDSSDSTATEVIFRVISSSCNVEEEVKAEE